MVAQGLLSEAGLDGGLRADDEAFVARLTQAAYEVALRHRPDRPFTELELALWRELRAVVLGNAGDVAGGLSRPGQPSYPELA